MSFDREEVRFSEIFRGDFDGIFGGFSREERLAMGRKSLAAALGERE